MKKQFLILFAFISVLAFGQAPQRFNKVIVTGDITSPKYIVTNSNNDSVLLGAGGRRAISAIKTDTVSLSNRINAKATGSGTANGTNTGDETLTSIKTKLGAATPVSDGYLKYQDWSIFNSKEPAITKNTAFNKNFGTTTGTVLEGRTFGTAANSAVGDFIQNQNSSAQTASMWIAGTISSSSPNETFRSVNSTNDAYSTRFKNNGGDTYFGIENSGGDFFGASPFESVIYSPVNNLFIKTPIAKFTGAATFSSTVNSTGFLLNGNNLTSSLTTNYIPKWNGSNFVNATAGTDYQRPITLTTNGTSGAATFSGNVLNVPNYASTGEGGEFTSTFTNKSNTTLSTPTLTAYTNINGIISASVFGAVTSTSAGKCTFRVSVPTTIRSERCAVVSGVESGKTTGANIFIEDTGSTYVDISFIASAPSSILEFQLITMGH